MRVGAAVKGVTWHYAARWFDSWHATWSGAVPDKPAFGGCDESARVLSRILYKALDVLILIHLPLILIHAANSRPSLHQSTYEMHQMHAYSYGSFTFYPYCRHLSDLQ